MSQNALLVHYEFCSGCHTCEVACQKEKQIPVGQWGIKLNEQGPFQHDGKWMWNYVAVPSDLCDMCQDRLDAGLQPSCVQHCLAKCMECVPLEKVGEVLAQKGSRVAVYLP